MIFCPILPFCFFSFSPYSGVFHINNPNLDRHPILTFQPHIFDGMNFKGMAELEYLQPKVGFFEF